MLCTTWGCKNTPKTPQFWGGMPEFLCTDIQYPSWKYNIGRIFKTTLQDHCSGRHWIGGKKGGNIEPPPKTVDLKKSLEGTN